MNTIGNSGLTTSNQTSETVLDKNRPNSAFAISNITILAMAVFILLSLGSVAFLYYQNQQLKSMLESYQTSIPSPTLNQTSNTTIYTNNTYGYSIQIPSWDGVSGKPSLTDKLLGIYGIDHTVIQIEPVASNQTNPVKWWTAQSQEYFTHKPASCFTAKTTHAIYKTLLGSNDKILDLGNIDAIELERIKTDNGVCAEPPYNRIIVIPHNKNLIGIFFDESSGGQILSTFKFLGLDSNLKQEKFSVFNNDLTFSLPSKNVTFNNNLLVFTDFTQKSPYLPEDVVVFQTSRDKIDITGNQLLKNLVIGNKSSTVSQTCGQVGEVNNYCQTFIDISLGPSYLRLQIPSTLYSNPKFSTVFDQILSTFKFTN